MSRLNDLAARHPGVPEPVLLKTDLLFAGLRVTPALIAAAANAMPHFRRAPWNGEPRTIPYFLLLPDGAGEELLVLVRPNDDSPYALHQTADGLVLTEKDVPLVSVRPQPRPDWYQWAADHECGRLLYALSQHGNMLVANLAPACEYWQTQTDDGEPCRCKFCGYGAASERSKGLGQVAGEAPPDPEVLQQLETVLAEAWPEADHLFLVGGSMLDRDLEAQRYLMITEAAARAAPDVRGAIGCGSQALPATWSKKIAAAGAGYACFNLEIWDPELWRRLCPGKAARIGRDQWLQDMCDAVDVFGRGAVISAFVAGAELVPPLGFDTPQEALDSALEGTDWLLERGIVPIYSPFSPAMNSTYDESSGPSLDYFLELNLGAAQLRRKHQLPVDARYVCHRCTYAQLECDLDRMLT